MTAAVLDGRAIAAGLKEELRTAVGESGFELTLAIARGGEDEAADVYARRLVSLCEELGVATRIASLSAGGTRIPSTFAWQPRRWARRRKSSALPSTSSSRPSNSAPQLAKRG